MSALPDPGVSGLVSRTTWQPAALVLAVVLLAWYLHAVRAVRRGGATWSTGRTVVFVCGVVLFVWTTNGWLEVYRTSLYWVWLAQTLTLLLLVPLIILSGHPLRLAMRTGAGGWVERLLRSGLGRFLASPLVGPALVPVLCGVLFFGRIPTWALQHAAVAWALQLLVAVIGAFVVLPLVSPIARPSSLAVGLALAIGSFELVLDAIPGIALRLHSSLVTSYFDHRATHSWTPSALHDQQIAGAILWCVSEVIDLPFLLLVYRRWLQADALDAAEVDAVLDAERAARGSLPAEDGAAEADRDAPWWLSDPSMQHRYPDGSA